MKIQFQLMALVLSTVFCQTHGQIVEKKTLSIGDIAPPIQALDWIKGKPVTTFKNDHIYIVEFGATWCVPCRAAIPKLTKLATQYKDKVTVISFFVMELNTNPMDKAPSYVEKVNAFIKQQGSKITYTVALDDAQGFMEKKWIRAAGLTGIPQAFIIDGKGKIAWIGSDTNLLEGKVNELVNKTDKTTVQQDDQKSAQYTTQQTNPPFLFQSLLSKYEIGQPLQENPMFINNYRWAEEGSEFEKKQGTINVKGENLRRLYYMAYGDTLYNYPMTISMGSRAYPDTIKNPYQKRSYGKYWYKPVFELTDSSAFEASARQSKNRFNYSLIVPKEIATAHFLQQTLRRDLKTYFGYQVTVEERLMPCWNLIATKDLGIKLRSTAPGRNRYEVDSLGNYHFKNVEVRDIIFELEIRYGYGQILMLTHSAHHQPPFIDATGIQSEIDYTVKSEFATAILEAVKTGKEYPFTEYQKLLQSLGFNLVKSYRKMKVVVIRNPTPLN